MTDALDYLRAQADEKPVAWMHDGFVSTNKEKVEHDEMRNRSCGFKPKPIVPLYAHPAAPQAEIESLRDLLRIEQALALRLDPFHCQQIECHWYGKSVRAGDCKCHHEQATKHRASVRHALKETA
jgi:hypothetical protein